MKVKRSIYSIHINQYGGQINQSMNGILNINENCLEHE